MKEYFFDLSSHYSMWINSSLYTLTLITVITCQSINDIKHDLNYSERKGNSFKT